MVFEKIVEILAEKLECDAADITMESTFAALGIDSLDATEVAMDVEDALGVEITMDKSIVSIGDLVKKVEGLLAQK